MKQPWVLITLVIPVLVTAGEMTRYIWPLGDDLLGASYVSNYYDQNGSSGGFLDYRCGVLHGYDGHRGTDIAVPTFRQSDQGIPVLAAAGGTVSFTQHNQPDRNYWPPYAGSGNGVFIDHADGTMGIYWHLRRDSIAVKVGETVRPGQVLGMVASSGNTPIPHLHFQLNQATTGSATFDLFGGDCNPEMSRWHLQPGYVAETFRVLGLGVFENDGLRGTFQNGALTELKDQPVEPAVYGRDRASFDFWVMFQGEAGDQFDVVLRSANGDELDRRTARVFQKRRYAWFVESFEDWAGIQDDSAILSVEMDGKALAVHEVSVGPTTRYGPRFHPVSGRSLRISGTEQRIALTFAHAVAVNLTLSGAPAGVRLEGNELVVPAASAQPRRNHHFSVVATDTLGRTDHFRVHLVDLSKDLGDVPIDGAFTGFWYDPGAPGQGVGIEVDESTGQLFLAWFTYQADASNSSKLGATDHRWLTAQGSYQDNQAELDVVLTTGGRFDAPDAVEGAIDGSAVLTRTGCNSALLDYAVEGGQRVGRADLIRLFPSACADD